MDLARVEDVTFSRTQNTSRFFMSESFVVEVGGHIIFSAKHQPDNFLYASLETKNGISPNLFGYIIGISIRVDWIFVTVTSFSRSQGESNTCIISIFKVKTNFHFF